VVEDLTQWVRLTAFVSAHWRGEARTGYRPAKSVHCPRLPSPPWNAMHNRDDTTWRTPNVYTLVVVKYVHLSDDFTLCAAPCPEMAPRKVLSAIHRNLRVSEKPSSSLSLRSTPSLSTGWKDVTEVGSKCVGSRWLISVSALSLTTCLLYM